MIGAIALAATGIVFGLMTKDTPDLARRRAAGAPPEPLAAMLEPLKNLRVWRFSLDDFFVCGAFVAPALGVPRSLIGAHGVDIKTAGMIGAVSSIPASVVTARGLSDPPTAHAVAGIRGPVAFSMETSLVGCSVTIFVLGFFMRLGKAAVYEHIPVDDPNRVGAPGGIVALVGGLGGFVRAGWDEVCELIAAASAYTVKTHGPDRVAGFSPIPAMSMVSYAAGSRYLSLLGGVRLSFYDWYGDLPPASPQTWGEQSDVPEPADWYNAGFLILWGSNVPQTRTPDAHFYTEARYRGAKSAVICPDYSEAAKFGDIWLSVKQGTDAVLALAIGHVILKEHHVDREVASFCDDVRTYTDMPMLVRLVPQDGPGPLPPRERCRGCAR